MEKRVVDKQRVENAVREILAAIGEDCNREGLKDTPARVARMLEELTAGYDADAAEHLSKTFDEQGSGLVVERDINFSSTCEHHLMPFFGKVHIAYVPDGKVVGLSKLARIVDVYAARLQEEGIYVTGFYYPVVPKGQARIRVQISAGHEKAHLDKCIEAFIKVGTELGRLFSPFLSF